MRQPRRPHRNGRICQLVPDTRQCGPAQIFSPSRSHVASQVHPGEGLLRHGVQGKGLSRAWLAFGQATEVRSRKTVAIKTAGGRCFMAWACGSCSEEALRCFKYPYICYICVTW